MNDDTISRAAALDALRTCYDTNLIVLDNGDELIHYGDAVGAIEALPSAQTGCEDAVYRKAVQMLLAYFVPEERYAEAVDGLRRLPSASFENHDEIKSYSKDTISRQAAIDTLKNRWKKTRNYEGIGDDIAEECELYLKQVPSAQPEIIRCKDCRHNHNCDIQYHAQAGDMFFCAGAERRTE